jgi:hypothetical protein
VVARGAWCSCGRGGNKESELATFLAEDLGPSGSPTDEDEDDDDLDDAEVFVEVKTGHFIAALGLPVPSDLAR